MDQMTSLSARVLGPVQKVRALVAVVRLIRDPNELDQVFAIADDLARGDFMDSFVAELSADPEIARAFVLRPRVGSLDLAELAKLPEGTLGHEFARHMRANGLDPSALPSRPSTTPREWLQAHLYETHDLWHVVAGFDTDVAGELGLQAFYLAQIPTRLAPALLGGSFFNTMLYAWDDRDRRMDAIVRGWTLGKQAKRLFGRDWSKLLATPLTEVRATLGLDELSPLSARSEASTRSGGDDARSASRGGQ